MANNRLGNLRRSVVVMTFGPGSVVDFRAEGAAVSAVAAGLEEWDRSFPPVGLLNPQRISEPRLERKLGVKGFRLPPVVDESWKGRDGNPDNRALVAARFPDWLQCPQCDRIAPSVKWAGDPGRPYRYCAQCTSKSPGQKKVFSVPVRFVMACEAGHLDDFPWHMRVGHKPDCNNKKGFLHLRSERPGLAGLIVSCPTCKSRSSMDGVFSAETWRGFSCSGKRPWLATEREQCLSQNPPRALQRGASNLYFPVMDSALSIPPWSDRLQEVLGVYWHSLLTTKAEDRIAFIKVLARGELKPALDEINLSPEGLAKAIEDRIRRFDDSSRLDIREEEYRQFTSGTDSSHEDDPEFETRVIKVPDLLRQHVSHVVRVVRLREVRAIRGFTRVNPPGDAVDPNIASLSVTKLDWLPAIEVRGEGIFLALATESLSHWEEQPSIRERAERADSAWVEEWRARYGDVPPALRVTPRFLLMHTFAHALIRQLTLDCGYSSASLRERLYVGEHSVDSAGMAGILIYTATSDSDGTLGGLQRQGEANRIARTVPASIQAMEWCSSDPLCIEGLASSQEAFSLAACHACVLAPETACEQFNRFLDRALLVGTPSDPAAGYFSSLLARS